MKILRENIVFPSMFQYWELLFETLVVVNKTEGIQSY